MSNDKWKISAYLPAYCLLPTAYCLLLTRRSIRLRRVVKLPRLDDVFFIIDNAVAVYVNTHFYLVLLAVVYVAGIERQAVLAAQERINVPQNVRQFAGEGNGEISAAGLFGKCAKRILRLKKSHSSRHAGERVGRRQKGLILFKEELAGADYVDWNTGILRNLARVSVSDLAEGVDARSDEYDRPAPALHAYQPSE